MALLGYLSRYPHDLSIPFELILKRLEKIRSVEAIQHDAHTLIEWDKQVHEAYDTNTQCVYCICPINGIINEPNGNQPNTTMPKTKNPNQKEINTLHNATVAYIYAARKVLGVSMFFPEYTKQDTMSKQMAAHAVVVKELHEYITRTFKA